jgi:hypothetical protein
MRRMTSRTSIAPMALRRLRAMPVDAGLAGRADRAGRVDREAAEIVVPADGAAAADGVPVGLVVVRRAAAETARDSQLR